MQLLDVLNAQLMLIAPMAVRAKTTSVSQAAVRILTVQILSHVGMEFVKRSHVTIFHAEATHNVQFPAMQHHAYVILAILQSQLQTMDAVSERHL